MPITIETIRKESKDALKKAISFHIETDVRNDLLSIGEKFIEFALSAAIGGSISRTLLDDQIKSALAKFDAGWSEFPWHKESLNSFLIAYRDKIISHSTEIKESPKKEQYGQLAKSERVDRVNDKSAYTTISIPLINIQSSAASESEKKSFQKIKTINLADVSNLLLHAAKKALNEFNFFSVFNAGIFFIASKICEALHFINEKLNAPEKLGNDAQGYAAYLNQTSMLFGKPQTNYSLSPIKENNSPTIA